MYITEEKQQELFKEYHTPLHVQQHCNEVTRVAVLIATKLDAQGFDIDIDELRGAAMVHDVLRVEEDHDIKAANLLLSLDFPHEAELVRKHMKYFPFNSVNHFKAIDVLCLADRVVKEHSYVGLDERMQYLIDKPGKNQERTNRILEAKEHTAKIIDQLEELMGITLDELCRRL